MRLLAAAAGLLALYFGWQQTSRPAPVLTQPLAATASAPLLSPLVTPPAAAQPATVAAGPAPTAADPATSAAPGVAADPNASGLDVPTLPAALHQPAEALAQRDANALGDIIRPSGVLAAPYAGSIPVSGY